MNRFSTAILGDVCIITKGETGLASANPGIYPLVTTGAERKTCDSFQFEDEAVCIPLVSSTGHGKKTLNYIHYQSGKFALGTILAAIIPKNKEQLSAEYLHRYLLFFKDQLVVPLMKGAANVSLSVKDIAKIKVPLPPIEQQKEFIRYFNRINEARNEFLQQAELQKKLLLKIRQSILQEAIEGKLTAEWRKHNPMSKGDPDLDAEALLVIIRSEKEKRISEGKIKKEKPLSPIVPDEMEFVLPEGWRWIRLGTAGWIVRGKSPVYSEDGESIILNQKCVRWFVIETAWGKTVSKTWLESIEKSLYTQAGDILVNSTGEGTIGRAAIVDINAANLLFDSHVLKYSTLLNARYIASCINSVFCQTQIDKIKGAKTTKQTELGVENLSNLLVPLAPLAEQKAIVEKVERLFEMVGQIDKQVSRQREVSEYLVQEVLLDAFEGTSDD